MDELEARWAELHDATPPNWFVGRPAYEPHRAVPWSMWAADMSERPKVGHGTREWTAVAPTEAAVIRAMVTALREIGAGRMPR